MNLPLALISRCSPLFLGAALLLPAAAWAQAAPPMAVWPSTYQRLDSMQGGADAALVLRRGGGEDGDAGVARVALPFGFSLLGQGPYTDLEVGARGIVVFGADPEAAADSNASRLLTTSAPQRLIAAWWGRHRCAPSGGVQTKTLGTAPRRVFVVEWADCEKLDPILTNARVRFEAQIHLYEGSDAVRVHYGAISPETIPPWVELSWGIKGSGPGLLGPNLAGARNACHPVGSLPTQPPKCDASDFPRDSVIQYGLVAGADLTGRPRPDAVTVQATTFEMEAELDLLNVGDEALSQAGFELYIASAAAGAPDVKSSTRVYTEPPGLRLAAGESSRRLIQLRAPRPPNGIYRLCALVDPKGEVPDVDRSNDWVCSHDTFSLGPDLVVESITSPPEGRPAGEVTIPATIRNAGNDRAETFDLELTLEPFEGESSITEVILRGTVDGGLAPGESRGLSLDAALPEILRAETYNFVLTLDPDGRIDESDRRNNSLRTTDLMTTSRPQLEISAPTVALPDGCFYGEELQASFTVCNTGGVEARGFHPGVVMGDEPRIGMTDDVTATSFPAYCGSPGTGSFSACEPIGSQEAVCAFEFCRAECEADVQCGAGLICAVDDALSEFLGRPAKGCMTWLDHGEAPAGERCQPYTMLGRIPTEDQKGRPYTDSTRYFHIVDDLLFSLSVPFPDVVTGEAIRCRPALLDLAAVEIQPLGRLVAGKDVAIARLIRNEGFINAPSDGGPKPERAAFTYRYYLGSTRDVSARQIPLEVHGGRDGFGAASIARKGSELGSDLVRIPPIVPPGTYYLGLILDPGNEHEELEKQNNVLVYPEPIFVEPRGLAILTERLPRAIIGARYDFSFVAAAGLDTYTWSAENLPPGLALTQDGLLQGRPTAAGDFAFTIRVSSAGAVDERMVALQVLEGQSQLEIVTSELPIAVKGVPYGRSFDPVGGSVLEGVQLAASGGQEPYTWAFDPSAPQSRLPAGLEPPSPQGVIRGQPTPMSATSRFLVRVSDALGNRSEAWLEIVVVDTSTLVVPNDSFPLATSGAPYGGCVEAQGGGGAYHWTVDEGSLPAGLAMEAEGARACLKGVPTTCGNFVVGLQVSDDRNQSSTAAPSLRVDCGLIRLGSHEVRPVLRGEEVEFQLEAIPSDQPTFRLHRGSLPPGLSLGEDGLIAGTVAADAAYHAHDVIVELSDAVGRRSLSALTLRVQIEPPPQKIKTTAGSGGCGSASDEGAALATLGLALLALGQVRREGRPARLRWPLLACVCATLAALGCGEDPITAALSRCAGVSCDDGFTCDEADGLCKCGGTVCAEGELCREDPSPSCVSPHCDFTRCERGQSCDAATGACLCGGVHCGEDEWCVAERCEPAEERCAGIRCPEGTSCDPQDGSCRCGGQVCEADEVCVEGACVVDGCAGIHCGPNGVCDPETGVCHCGELAGRICSAGEACVAQESEDGSGTPVPEGFRCVAGDLCDGSSCGGGTVCDPRDGLCRCGGVGPSFAACLPGQLCVDGACLDGDLCAPGGIPIVCEAGLSCDPNDGVCKCGGKGGERCGEDAGCVRLGIDEAPTCAAFCSLLAFNPHCGADEACYFDPGQVEGTPFCAPRGDQGRGALCSHATDCGADLYCAGGRCAAICSVSDGPEFCRSIGPQLECSSFTAGDLFGYCRGI